MKDEFLLATTILLYRRLALTTLLRIALDPISSLAVILTFLQPELRNRTDNRSMIAINRATKTKFVVRGSTTVHSRDNGGKGRLARRGWT